MKRQAVPLLLTVVNLALLVILLLPRIAPVHADDAVPPVVKARAFELVDENGRVRATLNIQPATRQPGGETSPETVLLRLITERGRPSVKIAASEQSSGLSFAGPTGTRDTYVILESRNRASSLKLRNENGREQVVAP